MVGAQVLTCCPNRGWHLRGHESDRERRGRGGLRRDAKSGDFLQASSEDLDVPQWGLLHGADASNRRLEALHMDTTASSGAGAPAGQRPFSG